MFADWYDTQCKTSVAWVQDLHRHPETGFHELRTAGFVARLLSEMGYDVATGIGGTGVVGSLRGTNTTDQGRCIAFRAELDALPMDEKSGLAYASPQIGAFHGCGHDGHTVTALTAAAYLAAHRDFGGTVRFIFQPAEELLTGARAMIADGLFDRFPCDEIYALHNLPGLPAGHVGVPATAALASADDIDVTIHGNGAHGSMPHTGEDTVGAAAHFISAVQQAASRVVDARAASVISFGHIAAGTARNILPETVRIEGTLRTNALNVRNRLVALLDNAARATELLFGVRIILDIAKVAPVTLNHPAAVAATIDAASRVVGGGHVIRNAESLMASEDFAELSALVPGAYFFVGQNGRALHHPEYVFDTDIIPIGAAIFADLAMTRTSAAPIAHAIAQDLTPLSKGETR